MILNNLSGPSVFAAIVLGLAVFLVPDGPWRLAAALVALTAILAWAYVEPRLLARREAVRAHWRRMGVHR